MNGKLKLVISTALGFLLTLGVISSSATTASAAEANDSVILVPLEYAYGKWRLGAKGVMILPCPAPNEKIYPADDASRDPRPQIKFLDLKGNVIVDSRMGGDPTIIYPEFPQGASKPTQLSKVSFNLRLKLVDGIDVLEFWHKPQEQKSASLYVDLSSPIKKYRAMGGASQKAACQVPVFSPY